MFETVRTFCEKPFFLLGAYILIILTISFSFHLGQEAHSRSNMRSIGLCRRENNINLAVKNILKETIKFYVPTTLQYTKRLSYIKKQAGKLTYVDCQSLFK